MPDKPASLPIDVDAEEGERDGDEEEGDDDERDVKPLSGKKTEFGFSAENSSAFMKTEIDRLLDEVLGNDPGALVFLPAAIVRPDAQKPDDGSKNALKSWRQGSWSTTTRTANNAADIPRADEHLALLSATLDSNATSTFYLDFCSPVLLGGRFVK
ncbi:hypothetical protein FA13DRAFT_1799051 [Coprinellus micaceus]|uniref:Uncharacterized protein n=1 Tax=Coprinellus micaceus TaxID=71717 RepID=A0A4Y7SK78_COPMI|nr:hypothetical protein FA13DRAFT_1799051 [Coprinellus micaceus]